MPTNLLVDNFTGGLVSPPYFVIRHFELVSESLIGHIGLYHPELRILASALYAKLYKKVYVILNFTKRTVELERNE